jgi:hypothetical protein
LSVQRAPGNPAAEWVWRKEGVEGQEVRVRVGGGFVFPPPEVERGEVERTVFVAGGVGVNPFLSMMGWIRGERGREWGVETRLLWSLLLVLLVHGLMLAACLPVDHHHPSLALTRAPPACINTITESERPGTPPWPSFSETSAALRPSWSS